VVPFLTPPIDIGREEARRQATRELLGPEYAEEPLIDRLWRQVNQFLGDLLDQESVGVVGSLAARAALLAIVVGIVVSVLLVARRAVGSPVSRPGDLFGDSRRTAAEHREAAERLAAEARWAEAVRERLRAVARDLEDRVIVDSTPGRTAGELAAEAGRALPALAAELAAAARVFDDVTYGEVPGTPEAYRIMCELDEHLRAAPVTPVAAS